jgi:hypothetical protein
MSCVFVAPVGAGKLAQLMCAHCEGLDATGENAKLLACLGVL